MTLARLAAGLLFGAGSVCAQNSRPAFEVASVKLNTHCDLLDGRSGGMSTPGRIAMECADLRDLILTAYGIYGNGPNPATGSFRMQVVGGPAWMDSSRYEIVAKPAAQAARAEMYGPILQSLLEDRFKLKVHRETKEGRVFLLTIAKNGPKLRAAKEGACIAANINRRAETGPAKIPVCGAPKISSPGTLEIYGATIANLCAQLGLILDREVVDKTELTGKFDIRLDVAPGDLMPRFVAGREIASDDTDVGPSIFSALQQQLGLRLEPGRGTVQTIVVDHIEQPTEN
jgi:uncharacterized protein (TIGR03435 family)